MSELPKKIEIKLSEPIEGYDLLYIIAEHYEVGTIYEPQNNQENIAFAEEICRRYNAHLKLVEALEQAEKVIEAQQKFITSYKTRSRRLPDGKHYDVLKAFRENNKIKSALKAAGGDDGLGS